jgi:hypothetical protein
VIRAGILALMALTLPAAALAHGAKEPATVEVTGEVIDLACFLSYGARGEDNARCASHHIAPDQPLALLEPDGTLHLLWAGHHTTHPLDLARQRIGQTVKVVGVPYERNGVKGLEVLELTRVQSDQQDSPFPSRIRPN